MTTLFRLVFSALIAAAAALLIHEAHHAENAPLDFHVVLFLIVFVATSLTALLSPTIQLSSSLPKIKRAGSKREQGKVKWFNVSKGYGFATRSSGDDVFVHFRAIRGKGRKVLREGQTIEFIVTQGEKGPQADEIEIIG